MLQTTDAVTNICTTLIISNNSLDAYTIGGA